MTQNEDYILIRKKKIPTETKNLPQDELFFWHNNPRIYSLLDRSCGPPDQHKIYEAMLKLEHVKELKEEIRENGGLIDPVIVRDRDSDYVVIEGNSRLAAYRWLASNDPLRWGKIRCRVVSKDITESDVYVMLGQYHVVGKKDWAPYERAGFVYRRHKEQLIEITEIAKELGQSIQSVKHLVNVYQFMEDQGEQNRDKWSHYDEFLKSQKIKNARENNVNFTDQVVKLIKSEEVRAVDIRDQLPVICAAPKVLKKFSNGKIDYSSAYEDARHAGGDSIELNKIKKFKGWLCAPDVIDEIIAHNSEVRQKIGFELGKIKQKIEGIEKQLNKNSR